MNKKQIFVFGSNREGRHGKGAAYTALKKYNAVYGQSKGLQGNSYGIITKELRSNFPKVTLQEIQEQVDSFLKFATERQELEFLITKIGCGLAGFKEEEIRPLFNSVPKNCILPDDWSNNEKNQNRNSIHRYWSC